MFKNDIEKHIKIYKRRKGESIPIKNEFHLFKKYTLFLIDRM
jgi:hypothetical protein